MKKQKNIFILIIFISIFFILNPVFSEDAEDDNNFRFKTQSDIKQIRPQKPVKIKLKRLASGKYSWDITGDNLDEIIKVDKKLRKLLVVE
ncbi:MAG: hypothetical protein AB1610_10395 [Nitrospirota bacterium]